MNTNNMVVILGLVVGWFAIPIMAQASPEVVNGLLLLILLAALLVNYQKWVPALNSFGLAVSGETPRVGNAPFPGQGGHQATA